MDNNIKVCSQCILDSRFPTIKFNKDNVCNFCTAWEKSWKKVNLSKTSDEIKSILAAYKGKTKPNDCVIGLSGGKDSDYMVYFLKTLGLNPLCVTLDNGFLSEEARQNIQRVVDHFSLTHKFVYPDKDLLFRLYRHFLLTTGEFCSVCNVAIRWARSQAIDKSGIGLAILATSLRTEANVPREYFCCSAGYFKNVAKSNFSEKEIKSLGILGFKDRVLTFLRRKNKVISLSLPNYIPWKEEMILGELKKVGINLSLWSQHTDCVMSEAKEYLKLKQFGMLEKTAKLSSLIKDGQISRKKALELIKLDTDKIMDNESNIRKKIMDTFKISTEQLDAVTELKPGPYLPKGELILEGTINMLRLLANPLKKAYLMAAKRPAKIA